MCARVTLAELRRALGLFFELIFLDARDDEPIRSGLVEGDLREAVTQLKESTQEGVLAGSPMLSAALERLGHGPNLFQAWSVRGTLDLVSTTRLKSGVTAMHYRRKEG